MLSRQTIADLCSDSYKPDLFDHLSDADQAATIRFARLLEVRVLRNAAAKAERCIGCRIHRENLVVEKAHLLKAARYTEEAS